MAVKAYLLLETQVGKTVEVVKNIRRLQAVISADLVTGPYDIIAIVQGETLSDVGHLITAKFGSINGVTKAVTCAALEIS